MYGQSKAGYQRPARRERSRAFFDIKIGDAPRGRIVFELFDDVVPKTVDNFRTLCTNPHPPQYKRSVFHRIIPSFIAQGGDFEHGDDPGKAGRGGYSIYDNTTFEDESFAGLAGRNDQWTLAMANGGPNANGSQWFINLQSNRQLDQRHVVFGRVVEGFDVVRDIESKGTQRVGTPTARVEIENCGMLG